MNKVFLRVTLLVLVYVIIFPYAVLGSENRAAIIGHDFKQVNLGKYLDILTDNSNLLTIEDVSSNEFQDKFIPSTKESLILGPPSKKIVWVRFRLKVDSSDKFGHGYLNLELGRPRYKVDFFQPSNNNPDIFIKKSLSKSNPIAIGDYEFRHLTFKIDTIDNSIMTCFVRFEVYGPEFIPFVLRSCEIFRNYTGYDYLVFGVLYGILLGMTLYNFFLFVTLRYTIYLQYVLQIVFFLLFAILFMGHLVPFLKLDIKTALLLEYSFLGLHIFFAIIFCRNFFNMKLMAPFWNTLLYSFQIISVCIVVTSLFGKYSIADLLANLSAGLYFFLVLTIAVIQWQKGFKPAGFYIIANLFYAFGAIIFIFWVMGAAPRNIPGELIVTMGPVIESILLSFSLAYRIRILEDDRRLLAQSRESYKHASRIDGMTGLYNKQYMFDCFAKELKETNQTKKQLSLIIMDVDNFKNFNDTYGHPEGDVVLKTLSDIITSLVRKFDCACRYGGEEFAIILPNTNIEDAFHVAERIRKTFFSSTFHPTKDTNVSVTISIGIALYNLEEDSDAFIRRADKALYMAKTQGKNRTHITEAVR